MKALNKPTRFHEIKAPKDTPRISRQRVWRDRSEWRKSADVTAERGRDTIDQQLQFARDVGSLEQQNYLDLADLTDRAGRIGIDKS
jgi:hypothetical protein